MWTADLARDPRDFNAAWKIARADYWIGGHAPGGERRRVYEQGIDVGRKAIALQPGRPEGHFWVAANMGAMAESFGQGLKLRRPIKDELETVLRIDPGFQRGSADRALGRWYFKVPRLFGGNHKQAEGTCERRSPTTRTAPRPTSFSRSCIWTTAAGTKRARSCGR